MRVQRPSFPPGQCPTSWRSGGRLASLPMRVAISEHTHLSTEMRHLRWGPLALTIRRTYRRADIRVAVYNGVADDLVCFIRIHRRGVSRFPPCSAPSTASKPKRRWLCLVPPGRAAGDPRHGPPDAAKGLSHPALWHSPPRHGRAGVARSDARIPCLDARSVLMHTAEAGFWRSDVGRKASSSPCGRVISPSLSPI